MREAIIQSLQNLRANKLRSFLTMFGILWGMISVVVLSATGEGFRRGNDKVLRELGKNIGDRLGRPHQPAGRRRARRPPDSPDARRCARDRRRIVDDCRRQPRARARRRQGEERLQRRHARASPASSRSIRTSAPSSSTTAGNFSLAGRRRRCRASRSSASTWPSSCSASATSSANRSR